MQNIKPKTESQPGDMSHPSREEWMAYLYGELPRATKSNFSAHLKNCPTCEAEVMRWRGAMSALSEWKLPSVPRTGGRAHAATFRPVLQWAAAAAIVLALGVALGRWASPASGDIQTMRAALENRFDRKLMAARAELAKQLKQQEADILAKAIAAGESASADTQRLVTELTESVEQKRAADGQALVEALKQLDNKWTALHASLRKELETVAVNTQDGFNDTQQRLYQIANFTQTPETR